MNWSTFNAIRNGTPLPKHHGRLIDGDKVIDDFANYGIDHMWDAFDLPDIIDESPIIIEADKCTYKETGCGSCKRQLDCPIEADEEVNVDDVQTIIEVDWEDEEE